MRLDLDLALYVICILAVALSFQGSRGIFEPDEGRYANVAIDMLHTGDWWIPRLNGLTYLDKPPAFYWSVVGGLKILGSNEWGARLGQALALTGTALLVAAWSGAAWGRRIGRLSGLAYATTLMPALAANILTPDTLLALFTTAASFGYWKQRTANSSPGRWRWALFLGCVTGLGLLTKGPAMLVFVAPMVLHAWWELRAKGLLRRPELVLAAVLSLAVGLSWYWRISIDVPDSAKYLFDNQIAGRLWNDGYNRNSQWWAPLKVYGLVLVFGSLPWSLCWWRLWRSSERARHLRSLWSDPLGRYLILATALPLTVFCLAKSRLELYILPVFPLIVMLTICMASRQAAHPNWGRRVLFALLTVVLIKGIGALVPVDRDSRTLARALDDEEVGSDECVDTLQLRAPGLSLYGYRRLTWHKIWPESYPYFQPPSTLTEGLPALLQSCGGRVRFIVGPRNRQAALNLLQEAQVRCSYDVLLPRADLLTCANAGLGSKDRDS